MTERLWLTEPRRKTALAVVTGTRGNLFRLDRSLYCPRSFAYRHPQVPDRGVVWTPTGEKRNLTSVFEEGGELWHRLGGTTPAVGERLQCHLDPARRDEVQRAHTALHLLLHTWPRAAGALVTAPEVRGGGHLRMETDARGLDPKVLAAWRAAALALVTADRPLRREAIVDIEVPHRLAPQPFADGLLHPGPATTREAVHIDGVGGLPCDGTLSERTGQVRDVVLVERGARRDGGTVLVWRIPR